MAVSPIFNLSVSAIKASLRLSGTANTDGLALIDAAIQNARVRFYDALGTAKVAEILAIPLEENPTTTDGILRLKAAMCEVAMVRVQLLRRMPVLFMDGSAVVREAWNEEGLTREAQRDIDREIERLEDEIIGFLDALEDGEEEEAGIRASTLSPDTTPQKPGDTYRGLRTKQIFPVGNDPC